MDLLTHQNQISNFELQYILKHKSKNYDIGLHGKIFESFTKTS
jgi:hypothetical protein